MLTTHEHNFSSGYPLSIHVAFVFCFVYKAMFHNILWLGSSNNPVAMFNNLAFLLWLGSSNNPVAMFNNLAFL